MDLEALREQFPITRNYNFLNHASVAPLPRCAEEALRAYIDQQRDRGYVKSGFQKEIEATRRLAAELINAKPDEIAFTRSTTEGISFIANGLKWNAGDNVVTAAVEFPSNMYPWMNLQSRGVQIRTILEENGRIPIDNLIDAIDSHTRVVTVSAVQYGSGYRIDLEELGAWCQKRGVLFCVDAIQACGVLPIDVTAMHIDFLATGGHKWLVSPEGTGFFYCDRELVGHLRPSIVGWRSMKRGADFDHLQFDLHDDARRFEASTYNVGGTLAMKASLELLMGVGIDNIAEHVLALTDRLVTGVRDKGYRIFSPRDGAERSAIVAIESATHDLAQLQRHLETEHRIITIIRHGRLRVSPHAYNSVEDIDRLVDALPKN